MTKLWVLALAASGLATGTAINGTLGWAPLGNATFQGPALGAASAVTVSATEAVNTLPLLFDGKPNDFLASVALGNLVLIPAPFLTLSVANINGGFHPDVLPAYASWGTNGFFRFQFNVTDVDWSSSAPTNLSLVADGMLIDKSNIFETTPGHISEGFTTTGTGAIDVSFTFSSEQAPIPETGSGLATLVGAALIWWRRPRFKK